MKNLLLPWAALACFLPQLSLAATNAPLTFIFLNTGPDRAKLKEMPQETVSQMQAAHVGNFGTQFNRGTLMAAGPLGDNGFIRGTVLLSVQTPEQVAEFLSPYIEVGCSAFNVIACTDEIEAEIAAVGELRKLLA